MRPEKLRVKVGKSIITIVDNGKTRIRTVRPLGERVIERIENDT